MTFNLKTGPGHGDPKVPNFELEGQSTRLAADSDAGSLGPHSSYLQAIPAQAGRRRLRPANPSRPPGRRTPCLPAAARAAAALPPPQANISTPPSPV